MRILSRQACVSWVEVTDPARSCLTASVRLNPAMRSTSSVSEAYAVVDEKPATLRDAAAAAPAVIFENSRRLKIAIVQLLRSCCSCRINSHADCHARLRLFGAAVGIGEIPPSALCRLSKCLIAAINKSYSRFHRDWSNASISRGGAARRVRKICLESIFGAMNDALKMTCIIPIHQAK